MKEEELERIRKENELKEL